MTTSEKITGKLGIGYAHNSIVKVGDKFKITHVDGVVVTETVAEVQYFANQYLYVCESCATYDEFDLRGAVIQEHNDDCTENLSEPEAWAGGFADNH